MSKLILHNTNPAALHQTVLVDLMSGYSTVDHQLNMLTAEFMGTIDFSHPLLKEPGLSQHGAYYDYTYDTVHDFFSIPKRIYATLLHASKPWLCQFKITPSEKYRLLKTDYALFFSAVAQRAAKESMSTQQLNAFISSRDNAAFQYQDKVILDQILTVHELAKSMDGDHLYQANADIEQFCLSMDNTEALELRYINQHVGMGVFARERFPKDSIIVQYCGELSPEQDADYTYKVDTTLSSYALFLDARTHGNMARFINYAPDEPVIHPHPFSKTLTTANTRTQSYNCYGNNVVIFFARRAIEKGEQLLNDYGDAYFKDLRYIPRLQVNGSVKNYLGKPMKDTPAQRFQTLTLLKQQGVKQAHWLLLKKPTLVLLSVLLWVVLINLWGV
jgi:hypothetical protein